MPSFRFHRPNVSPSKLLGRQGLDRFHLKTKAPSVARYSVAAEAAFKPTFEDFLYHFKRPTEKPHPAEWIQYNKSGLAELLRVRAPHLDYRPYLAASHVFPMRMNNYVVDNLIDWYDLASLFSLQVETEDVTSYPPSHFRMFHIISAYAILGQTSQMILISDLWSRSRKCLSHISSIIYWPRWRQQDCSDLVTT
jgi:hypothetical protein